MQGWKATQRTWCASALSVAVGLSPIWAAAQTVTSFTVFNADTGADIATFAPNGNVTSGTVSATNTPRINVRANAKNVDSVVFSDGSSTRTENTAPYTYKSTGGTGYTPWSPAVGTYVITAKPYSGKSGSGKAGTAVTLTLTVAGTSPPPPPPPPPPVATDKPASRNEAARFLAQATFGPVDSDIDRLMSIGYSAWIDEQFATPRSGTHLSFFNTLSDGNDKEVGSAFWKNALTGRDQLRLRMAYALSQIFVISLEDGDVDNYDRAVAAWLDMLNTHSFGNYRQLLESVSLNPMMGMYLTFIANQKADEASGRVPDENYAREVMQLFSIGLVQLDPQGRAIVGSDGAVLETYTPADVSGLAKVFTGWSWACPVMSDKGCFLRGESNKGSLREYADRDLRSMVAYPSYHSVEAKSFLGVTIPAGTSAVDSLRIALDRLATHPNTGPFIGRQLIQRFTTSNPSPAYVGAVASAFNNNGSGVRGDFKAVLKAVLLHPEAREVGSASGKVREPVLRLSAFMRAFGHDSRSGDFEVEIFSNPATALGQAPLHSPSVFNFYRPGYVAPGIGGAASNLVAPELQIVNETSVAGYVNFMRDSVSQGVGFPAGDGLTRRDIQSDYKTELALATNAEALVERVTTRLTYGAMSAERRKLISDAVKNIAIPSGSSTSSAVNAAMRQRVNAAILLTVAAPEFIVIK
ncbi:MAG: DUF1800 domain-containing protein [Betaproteobacteria bacterium]|nr:MAG: DUF1800 domain-containing protein [Betaproteobacteria bacterium]